MLIPDLAGSRRMAGGEEEQLVDRVRAAARRWGVPVRQVEVTPDGFLLAHTGPDHRQAQMEIDCEW